MFAKEKQIDKQIILDQKLYLLNLMSQLCENPCQMIYFS